MELSDHARSLADSRTNHRPAFEGGWVPGGAEGGWVPGGPPVRDGVHHVDLDRANPSEHRWDRKHGGKCFSEVGDRRRRQDGWEEVVELPDGLMMAD
jgi:hypothetical protein